MVAPDLDERISAATVKAVTEAIAQLRSQNQDFAFVGCALTNIAAATIDPAARPSRDRQLPLRYRQQLPSAADHYRVGRPDISHLPFGHERVSSPVGEHASSDISALPSEAAEVLTLLDSAQLSLERARSPWL